MVRDRRPLRHRLTPIGSGLNHSDYYISEFSGRAPRLREKFFVKYFIRLRSLQHRRPYALRSLRPHFWKSWLCPCISCASDWQFGAIRFTRWNAYLLIYVFLIRHRFYISRVWIWTKLSTWDTSSPACSVVRTIPKWDPPGANYDPGLVV